MEMKTSKRIVSKGRYAKAHIKHVGMIIASAFLFWMAGLCAIGMLWLLLPLLFLPGWSVDDGRPSTSEIYTGLILLILASIGTYIFGKGARIVGRRAFTIDPGIPLTRANVIYLPAPDSLVRASSEPEQVQQAVLLRAAAEGQEKHEEHLVCAFVEGQK